jgi:hypothetical protein
LAIGILDHIEVAEVVSMNMAANARELVAAARRRELRVKTAVVCPPKNGALDPLAVVERQDGVLDQLVDSLQKNMKITHAVQCAAACHMA